MLARKTMLAAALGLMGLVSLVAPREAKAEDWGRYYHWPYNSFHQYQWSPYEYRVDYPGGFRYPEQMRVMPNQFEHRSWLTVRKPFYRGHHFILDRF